MNVLLTQTCFWVRETGIYYCVQLRAWEVFAVIWLEFLGGRVRHHSTRKTWWCY